MHEVPDKDKVWRGWSVLVPEGFLGRMVFTTRSELIQFECWNMGEVQARDGYSGIAPWRTADADEVRKAWRRIKRNYGCRAVSVIVRIASWEEAAAPEKEIQRAVEVRPVADGEPPDCDALTWAIGCADRAAAAPPQEGGSE